MQWFLAVLISMTLAAPPPPDPDELRKEIVDPDGPVESGALRFSPRLLDFGEMDRGDSSLKVITVTNISESPVRFVRSFTTCGCTVPELPREPIAPGETVEVEIEFQAKNIGPQGSSVRLYLANQEGDVHVDVVARVRPPIVIYPEAFKPDAEEDVTFNLRSTDGQPFNILSVDPPILEWTDGEPAKSIDVILSAVKLRQLQNRVDVIRIYVNHPRTASLALRSTRFETLPQTKKLIEWARGDLPFEELTGILEAGADLFETDARGMTPLMYAAIHSDPDRVRALMEFGSDPNAVRKDDWTALMGAAGSPIGSADILQMFLDAGGDVNAVDKFGRSALYWAARSGDAERITMLIGAGADLDTRGPFGETVLMSAAKGKKAENLAVLIEAGVDVFATDDKGRDARFYVQRLINTSQGDLRAEREEMARLLEEAHRNGG